MAKMSNQVRNRSNNAAYVASSVDNHGAKVARSLALEEMMLPTTERLGSQDIERFMTWLGKMLSRVDQGLTEAEQSYVREQANDPSARSHRDQAFEFLLARVIEVRNRTGQVFGKSVRIGYGLGTPPPRMPQSLLGYARTAADLLTQQPRVGVDSLGVEFDTVQIGALLQEGVDALDEALAGLLGEKRKLDATMLLRNERMEHWGRAYRGVGMTLAGLYELAGENQLAQRIRPNERRASGAEGAPDEEVPGTDTGGDGESGETGASAEGAATDLIASA